MFGNLPAAAAASFIRHLSSSSSTTTFLRHISTTTTTDTAATTTRVGLYFDRARAIDRLRLLLRRHLPLPSPPTTDSFVAAQALRCAPSPSSALSLFLSLPHHLRSSPHTLHPLSRHLPPSLFLPSLPPLHRLRLLSSSGDAPSTLQSFRHLRPSAEAYNLLLAVYVKNHMHTNALETFLEMVVEKGMLPNSRTYTLIIEHLLLIGDMDYAREVFDKMPLMRSQRTTRQYDALSEALSLAGRFGELRRLINEMGRDGIMPGRAMRAAMLRMRELGFGEGVIEEFERDLFPDDRISYVVHDDRDEDKDDGDAEDEGGGNYTNGGGGEGEVKLKPWLDPYALAGALRDWDAREVEVLEGANLVWTPRLVWKVLRGFRNVDTAWKFFHWVAGQSGGFVHDRYTISGMITLLAKGGHEELVDELILKAKPEGIWLPFSTVRQVIELYGVLKRPEAASRVFEDAGSICGHVTDLEKWLLCSSLLHTLVKCRRGVEAMNVLEKAISEGTVPDVQTLSGLMQFYSMEGDLEAVQKLFWLGRQCKVEPDVLMYQVLVQAYIKHGRTSLALRMFEDMRNLNLVPDAATKKLLVKRLWNEGRRMEVAYVEERCEQAGKVLPLAVSGHVWIASAADLRWVCSTYSEALLRVDSEPAEPGQ